MHHPSSPLEAIRAEAGAGHVDFLDGTDHAAAAAAAADADLVVIFAEEWRAEGYDMPGVNLPAGQEDLIEKVAAANPRTVVVIESGGAIAVPWAAYVPAVLAAFYPGIGGGPAIAGVLFGRVNPSGHLPVTFRVSCIITNSGSRAGAAVPKVYASRATGDTEDFVPRLAAFTRVHLEAGESRAVDLTLEPRLLARWDKNDNAFRIAGGTYQVRVGAHALDDRMPTHTINLAPALPP